MHVWQYCFVGRTNVCGKFEESLLLRGGGKLLKRTAVTAFSRTTFQFACANTACITTPPAQRSLSRTMLKRRVLLLTIIESVFVSQNIFRALRENAYKNKNEK